MYPNPPPNMSLHSAARRAAAYLGRLTGPRSPSLQDLLIILAGQPQCFRLSAP